MTFKRLLVSTAVVALAPAAALAQQAAQSGGLEEIVVTAERREASLQTVPVAITALSIDAIEKRQVKFAQDLERYTPSLKMRNNITQPTNLSPSLRGSTQQDASLVVAESPFGIYVDDVYLARLNGNNVQLADFERVEVLRGPQGTLYGRNTLAGAIKFITRQPGPDNEWLNAEVGYGRFDAYRASVSAGGPLSDAIAASIAVQTNGRNGYWNNLGTGQRIGDEKNIAGRAKLRYTGSDVFDATVSVSYTDSDNDALMLVPMTTPSVPANRRFRSKDLVPTFGFYTLNRPLAPRGAPPMEDETRGETQQLIASLNMTYDISDNASLQSITGFVNTDDYFTGDFSGVGRIMAGTNADTDQFSQELKLQGTAADGAFSYIAGVYYFRESADQVFSWRFITPASTSLIDAKTKNISVFGQADYNVTDALKVTAGIRYARDNKDFFESIAVLPTSIVPSGPQPPVVLDNTYKKWTPKFGIDYTVPTSGAIDSLLLYASAARGFKSGGYSAIAIFNLNDARTPYGPESNWTYEAGFKVDMLDNRLRVNANYYMARISDLTLNATVTVNGISSFPVQNAGDATIKGLEWEITAVPVDNLTLFANGAFSSGKFRNLAPGSAPTNAPASFGVTNPEPPQLPDATYTIGFDYGYDFALGNRDARFLLGADIYHTDSFVTAATNDFVLDGFDRVNGFIGLSIDERWQARFSVSNLTKETTIMTGSRALGGFLTMAPREYLLTLKYSM
ncbi:MAG: TonB-dependent receptor [Rhodospirillaceae bacterium]|nr:TonB-dependent receptor [Rhodospirillaceae bacterium]